MKKKELKELANQLSEELILNKILEETLEMATRGFQINVGKDKEVEFLLEISDVISWLLLYQEKNNITKDVDKLVRKKLLNIKAKSLIN